MKRRVSTILLSISLISTVLVGCTVKKEVKNTELTTVSIIAPDGLPSISMAKIAKEDNDIKDNYDVEYKVEPTAELLSTSVMKQEPDIAIVPSNMAAIAYNKTSNYQIVGTTGMGSFYLVSTKNIKDYSNLEGLKVGNTGKGLTPDITVQSVLKDSGVDLSKVEFDYYDSAAELVPAMLAGKIDTAFIPEPALTGLMAKNKDIKIVKSLNDGWKEVNSSENGYPQSTVIMKSDFVESNKEFVDEFKDALSESVDWAIKNTDKAGEYAKEIGVSTDAKVISKSLERSNLKFVSIEDMTKDYKDYYQKLFDFDAKTVGGSLPDEGIYYKEK